MNVTVQLFAQLAVAAGKREHKLSLPTGTSAQDCIRNLASGLGQEFSLIALRDDALHPTILLFVDDQQIDWNTNTPLHNGSALVLAMPIAGG